MEKINKFWKRTEKIREGGLDLVFPARCPVCDEAAPFPELICPACRNAFVAVSGARCQKCGKHVEDEREEYCRGCRIIMHQFDRGMGLFTYESVAKSMYRFKYAGRREYARYYGEEIVRRLGRFIRVWKPDALVPVPVHYTRKRERGYNQAEVLAKVIGGKMGIPVEGRLIRRVRKTLPQKLLGDRERQNNLKRAFKIDRNDVKLKTVIIIDDIYTTGSTVDACAAALKCAGVKKVYFITAAIGKELL